MLNIQRQKDNKVTIIRAVSEEELVVYEKQQADKQQCKSSKTEDCAK